MVASNLRGDTPTDPGAAICGSLGIAPSGNSDSEVDDPSIFERVRGSAYPRSSER